ncbi:hypothetical protein ACFL0M_03245, partial [Thermodesulfobacteriota bacterium]
LKVKFISGFDAGTGNGNPAFDTLSGLINATDPLEINLLRNTENLNLVFEDQAVVFRLDRFVQREKKFSERDETKIQVEALETPSERGRRPRRGIAKAGTKTALTEDEAAQKKKINQVIAVIIVFLFLFLGFKGYGHIEKLQKRRKNLVSSYLEKQNQMDTLISQQDRAGGVPFSAGFAETKKLDKNFWVEKLLYVAEEMSDKIWLSSINLEKGGEEQQQKLVIKGFVRKSTEGHLMVVSNFIKELISNKQFMQDFNDVTFDGIQMDIEKSEKVTFGLICWYQRNVNISEDEDEKKGKGSFMGADDAIKAVTEHRQSLDKVDKEIQGR